MSRNVQDTALCKRYADFATLQMAYAYEQATRWNLDKYPPALSA